MRLRENTLTNPCSPRRIGGDEAVAEPGVPRGPSKASPQDNGRTRPSFPDESVNSVPPVVECLELLAGLGTLSGPLGPADPLRALIGPGGKIEKVLERVRQVADSCFTILIEGETGTGKELVARAIHLISPRRKRHFIALDCGAIPETLIESELFGYEKGAFTGADRRKEGHFQLAERGTLFLDEIVNLPSTTQAKLLRALQERQVQPLGSRQPVPVDVRIIATCNVPLEREMWAGRFRQDLYYRLNEFSITLPPLRERVEDILYLANRFLVEASMELQRPIRGITEDAAQLLLRYPWPGNVRELRNVIRQAVLLSSNVIGPEHLAVLCGERAGAAAREAIGPVPHNGEPFIESVESPEAIMNNGEHRSRYSLREWKKKTLERMEKEFLTKVLEDHDGNVSHTAKALGVYRSTLQRLMKRHNLPAF